MSSANVEDHNGADRTRAASDGRPSGDGGAAGAPSSPDTRSTRTEALLLDEHLTITIGTRQLPPVGTGDALVRVAWAAISSTLARVNRYPEPAQALDALARYVGTAPDRLILTNRSDELCYLVATLLLGPGSTAVVGEPCYQIDATASLISGADVRRVPRRDGGHDLEAMAMVLADAEPSVVWLPSPHNPTGVACGPAELKNFLSEVSEVPEERLVVLDEAYRAFSDPEVRPDVEGLACRTPEPAGPAHAVQGLRPGRAASRVRAGIGASGRSALPRPARFQYQLPGTGRGGGRRNSGSERSVASHVRRRGAPRTDQAGGPLGPAGRRVFRQPGPLRDRPHRPGRARPALAAAGTVVRSGVGLGLPGRARISIGRAPQMAVRRSVFFSRSHIGRPSELFRKDQ